MFPAPVRFRDHPRTGRLALCAWADGGTFGQVPGLHLRFLDSVSGAEPACFDMAAGTETAYVCGELYRRGGGWKFRAVGQGYASGLAGLATDFGIGVDDVRPPAAPAARTAPTAPAIGQGVPSARPTKGEELLPVDMRERLSLRKRQVAVSLSKRGLTKVTARVVLVLDASGSMSGLCTRGTWQVSRSGWRPWPPSSTTTARCRHGPSPPGRPGCPTW